jgi:3-oxoacyl-[acyl-carrier-protein] synthase-1
VEPFSSPTSIAIIGLGVRCAVGLDAPAAAAAVRAGISGIREHPYMLDKAGEPMVVALEPTLDAALQGPERFAHLAEPALKEALSPLAERNVGMQSVHTLVGTPDPRPGLPAGIEDALDRLVASATDSKTRPRTTLLPNGHAAEGILKSSENRNGFPPGEAAGFCLLTTGATALELRLPVLGWLETFGSAREKSPIRTPTICVGRGLSETIQQATAPLRLPEERVDESICDLNGEPYRSEEFALTVLRTQMAFVDFSRFVTPADCWGDVGAASGPLFANLAIAAGLRGYAKGLRTMIWASSEGGDRAAAVVFTPPPARGANG